MNFGIVNNKKIFAFTSKEDFLNYIDDKQKILIALNAEKLNKPDIYLENIVNNNIGYADGVGAVWALKRKGIRSIKIAGAEFWLDIIKKYHDTKSFYFIGATQEVIDTTVNKLKQEYPHIRITGYRNGFLEEGEEQKIISELKTQRPDIVYVAMGSPKQEFLMVKFLKEHPGLYMGLGGSFDVYCGLKKRAPRIFQKLGLEWFYRLLKEPTRWRRQLALASFLLKTISNKI